MCLISADYRFVFTLLSCFFFFNHPATTEIYTLSLHDALPISLAVSKSGPGTVLSSPAGIDCGPTCAAPFDSGTIVALTAVPDASSRFAGWSGGCTGSGDCKLTLDADSAVSATFI